MAIYAVASRFASPDCSSLPLSPDEFARLAARFDESPQLDMNELKASILLCLHSISSGLSWNAVGDIARISRMANHYYNCVSREQSGTNGMSGCDAEEWRSVWWCIYSLDTFFSATS
ncbi:hypothetical protein ColLi_04347 [Colletotrichum liriopes]|uniref:Xylanolytic transcriptional activator regulatory domain-containing protein n=1 Tax=Colletotrichum liriopes TaxID=708192 RepID=A0AA37GIB1_9PEZI|nr:hypothetical protein ColLi_04347 [Colletotrichum liriopes]